MMRPSDRAAYQLVDAARTLGLMTTQIAVRLDSAQIEALDTEVTEGRAASRSDAVRRGIAYLSRAQRHRNEDARLIELARRGEPIYPDLDALLDAERPPLD